MFRGFSGNQRVAPLAERRVATQLREALAALPAPWIVLANRRASGADGPPWVRFLALHPAKGIALVDTGAAEAATAPLEDFLARTGFPALQPGALPIVPVAIGPDEITTVADILESVFARVQSSIGNPNWCDAVVELLLAAPDLMLSPLRRNAHRPAPMATQTEPSFHPAPQPARAEPPRPAVAATPPAPPPEAEAESVRLVPRRVTRHAEPHSKPRAEPQPSRSRPAARQPETPDVPQFLLQGDEPRLALEAGEPIIPLGQGKGRMPRQGKAPRSRRDPTFGAGFGSADAAWREPRTSRRRLAFVPVAAGLLLVAAGAVALRYHESSLSPPADTVAQSPPPSPTASLTPTPPPMPSPLPTVSPTPAATAPTPPSPPAPPVHAAAKPSHTPTVPPVKKADADLPRDMLQPQIVSAPPPPPPLPAAKLAPKPVRTATAKPQSPPPAPADTDLPASIEAVLHPGATPPATAPTPTTAAPPVATTAAAAPTGGEVNVNGVGYVNGEQPHSLGALGAPSPAAVASNAPPPVAAAPPGEGEVVISRAPAATVISNAPAPNTSSNAGASGPPRGIVATPVPAPSSGSDSGNGAAANGPPTAMQTTPAPGSSSP